MEKEKIIAKLNINNYTGRLEKILQEKSFSEVSNNLLLSMLYKIENSYDDYKKVKVNVENKKEYIEKLFSIIENDCKKIKIVKLNTDEAQTLDKQKNKVIKNNSEIITYQNELTLLESIYELNSNSFSIESKDPLRKKAFSSILDIGEIEFKIEPLRDFDGWSWNTNTKEIKNYNAFILYQVLSLLIGQERLENSKSIEIKELKDILIEKYSNKLSEDLFKIINQFAIVEYLKNNKDEIKELTAIKEDIEYKRDLMNDKKSYINEIAIEKIECIKEIEKIDKYINNDIALKKEYIKQNAALPQDKRVFSLSDFSEKIEKERDFLNKKRTELTEKLKPQNFVKEKTRLEQNYKYIEELDLDNLKKKDFTEELLKLLLKAFEEQIKKIQTKKEIIDKIYELRYINLFNLSEKKTIGKVLKVQLEKIQKKIITMACNLNAITIFSKDVEENFKIYKNIFNTKIIDLESVYIEIDKDNTVRIYDEKSLESQEKNNKLQNLIVKYNKKIKVFI